MSKAQFVEQAETDIALAVFLALELGVSQTQVDLWVLSV